MNFLAPLFLLGALAVALPVVFHLIRRTSRERMPFSSLMFLQSTPPRVTRRSRLENLWLLVLRCLVLCLLAVGFARPFFPKPMLDDPQASAGKRIVVLIDTSASMRRDNLWADARAKAAEVVRKASPADQVAVFTFDRQVNRLIGFEQWSARAVGERAPLAVQQLAGLTPGWAGTDLGGALVSAVEALEEKTGRADASEATGRRQIVLISDLQEGSHLEALQAFEWPQRIELVIESLKAKRPTNAGVQIVLNREETDPDAADMGLRVRVSNSADSRQEQFVLRWERAGTSTGQLGAAGIAEIYVPPGQSRVVPAPKTPSGLLEERLVLRGDDDDFDNTAYLVPPKAEQIRVLYLGNEAEQDTAQPLFYLQRAFQQTRRQIVQVIARRTDATLAARDWETIPLAIISEALPEAQLGVLRDFLRAGGHVLLVLKHPGVAQAMARLADGASVRCDEATASRYALLGQVDFQHPLFAPFADPRFSDFTKIHFWKHRRLETNGLARVRVLARFDNDDPALLQLPVGKGSLFVLTSGWQPQDSQLALSSKFVPLLYSLLGLSGGLKAQLAQYHVGDEVVLPRTAAGTPLTVRKPDGSEVQAGVDGKFTQTGLPGIYTVTGGAAVQQFAVNLDPAESKTAPLPVEELEHLGVALKPPEKGLTRQAEETRHLQSVELENRQKLWRWLILATFLILIVETWLAGRLTRSTAA